MDSYEYFNAAGTTPLNPNFYKDENSTFTHIGTPPDDYPNTNVGANSNVITNSGAHRDANAAHRYANTAHRRSPNHCTPNNGTPNNGTPNNGTHNSALTDSYDLYARIIRSSPLK